MTAIAPSFRMEHSPVRLQKAAPLLILAPMAHNNGMIPKPARKRAAKAGDNAARFQAAKDAVAAIPDEPIDPAYQTVPISEFVPHRPVMPAKSEGGRKFKLAS